MGIFLLATISTHTHVPLPLARLDCCCSCADRHSPFVPWSTSHLHVPGLKGYGRFGLMSFDLCVEDRCKNEDYDWY
jgi:hypothetical protein